MKNKFFQYAIVGILAVTAYYIWQSDVFQKTIFPNDYWQKEVACLEDSISLNEMLIRDTYRDIERIVRTADLDIKGANDLAETMEADTRVAVERQAQEIQKDIKTNIHFIAKLSGQNERLQKELLYAKEELSKSTEGR